MKQAKQLAQVLVKEADLVTKGSECAKDPVDVSANGTLSGEGRRGDLPPIAIRSLPVDFPSGNCLRGA